MEEVVNLELCPSELCRMDDCTCPQNSIKCTHCKSPTHHSRLHKVLTDKGLINDKTWFKKKKANTVNNVVMGQSDMDEFDAEGDMTGAMGGLTVNNMTIASPNGEFHKFQEIYPFTANHVKRDPESVKLLHSLIENAKTERKTLPMDSWSDKQKQEMIILISEFKAAVLGAQRKPLSHAPGPAPKQSEPQSEAEEATFTANKLVAVSEALEKVTISNQTMPPHSISHRPATGIKLDHLKRSRLLPPHLQLEVAASNISSNIHIFSEINSQNTKDLVNVRSHHPQLHQKILTILKIVFNSTQTRQLNFVRVLIEIPDPTPERLQQLSKVSGVEVKQVAGSPVASVIALADPGSNISLGSQPFLDAIDLDKIRQFNNSISTVAGETSASQDYRYKLSLKTDHSTHNLSLVKIPEISPERAFSVLEMAILEELFGLDEDNSQNIRFPFEDTKCHLLLSNDCPELTSAILPISDVRPCGWKYNIMSPSLRFWYIPWAEGEKFIVSGSFGVDPKLIQKSIDFPKIILPKNDLQEAEARADDFFGLLKDPDKLVSSSFLAQKKIRRDCKIVESEGAFDASCFNLQISNAQKLEGDLVLNKGLSEELFNVHLTAEDCKKTANFVGREAALLTPFVLCNAHQKLQDQALQDCKLCGLRNTNEKTLKHEERHYDLWDKVSLKDEKKFLEGGSTKVIVSPTFEVPLKKIGSLENSNFMAAQKASFRLFKKSSEQNALNIVDNQIRDKVFAGYLEIVPPSIVRKIMAGEITHQFVSKNSVVNLNSTSTPLRIVSNTANNIPGTASSLVSTDTCPAFELTKLLDISIRSFCVYNLAQGDLAKAYNMLELTEDASMMYLSYWFLIDQDNPNTNVPLILRSRVVDFGFASASALLNIGIVKYGSKAVVLVISVRILENSVYIDNINFDQCKDIKILAAVILDIKKNLLRIGFHLNKLYVPRHLYDHPDMAGVRDEFEFKEETVTLGMKWNLVTDEMVPATSLSLHGTNRGMPEGEKLTAAILKIIDLTRMHEQRLAPSLWDNTGRFLAPAIATAKILLSKVCKAVPLTELHTPIKEFDEELAKMCHEFWTNVVNIPIEPTPRSVVPEGYQISHVIVDHDGSHQAIGAVLIVLSTNPEGKVNTGTVLAKSIVSADTVPSNENRGYTAAVSLLLTFINAMKPSIDPLEMKFNATILGDNIPSTYLFKKEAKSVLNRNIRANVLRTCVTISEICPEMITTMAWIPGKYLVSDLCSKIFLDAAAKCNTSFWRHGPPEYKDLGQLEHFWFLKHRHGLTEYRDLPKITVADNQTLEEIIMNNPMNGPPGYSVIFDNLDHKVQEHCPPRKEFSLEDVVNMCVSNIDLDHNSDDEEDQSNIEESQEVNVSNNLIEECFPNGPAPGYSDLDIQEAILRYFFPEDCSYVVNALTRQGAKSRQLNLLSRNRFESSLIPTDNNNILSGVTAPEPMSREFYGHFMMQSNNVITLINSLVLFKRKALQIVLKREKRSLTDEDVESIIQQSWALIVSSDQHHFPVASSDETHKVNKFLVVHVKLRGIALPVLSQHGPLLRKILLTKHISPDRNGGGSDKTIRMTVMHIPAVTLRNKFLTGEFACYAFSLDQAIKTIVSKCAVCIRTAIKGFKFKPGDKLARADSKSEMWKRISLDPCGPYSIRKHEDLRKGGELDVYFLMGADHATGAFLIQAMGSLQHPSVILAVKTMERRTGATFHWIHVDKGSSLSPALLESPHRDWTVIQACPTYHSSILVEGKIRQFRQFWNRFHRKFSKENKKAIILNVYEMLFLMSNIEYQINSIPYSRHNPLAPSHFMYARGIEGQLSISDFIESLEGTKKTNRLKPLSPYLEKLEILRDEILTETFTKKSSLHNTPEDSLYYPCTGDLVLCLTGSLKTSEMGTVTEGVENVIHDQAHTDPRDQNEKISQRKVYIHTKTGGDKLYPVQSLCPLAEAKNSLDWNESSPDMLKKIPGKIPLKLALIKHLGSYCNYFSGRTKETQLTRRIVLGKLKFIFSTFSFPIKTQLRVIVVASLLCRSSVFFLQYKSQSANVKLSISKLFRSRQIHQIHDCKMSMYIDQHENTLNLSSGNPQSCPVSTSDHTLPVLIISIPDKMKFAVIAALMVLSYAAPVPDPSPFQLGLNFNSNDHESQMRDSAYLTGGWADAVYNPALESIRNTFFTSIFTIKLSFPLNQKNACNFSFRSSSIQLIIIFSFPQMKTLEPRVAQTRSNGGPCWGPQPSPGPAPPSVSILGLAGVAEPSHPRDRQPARTSQLARTDLRCWEILLLSIIMRGNKFFIFIIYPHVTLDISPHTSIVTFIFNHPRMHPCHNTIISLKCPLHMLVVTPVFRVVPVKVSGLMSDDQPRTSDIKPGPPPLLSDFLSCAKDSFCML